MKTFTSAMMAGGILALVLGCGCGPDVVTKMSKTGPANSPGATPSPTRVKTDQAAKKAFRISGNIDDARQEGDVCDTSVKFKVPGTLQFEFTPKTPTTGEYTYSGPLNATGGGPYEIRDDGTMFLDGTGCIMGKCATYSHEWKAEPIDPAACKGK